MTFEEIAEKFDEAELLSPHYGEAHGLISELVHIGRELLEDVQNSVPMEQA